MFKQGNFFVSLFTSFLLCVCVCVCAASFYESTVAILSSHSTELTVHIWLFPTVSSVQTAGLDRLNFSLHFCCCPCCLLSPIYLSGRTLRADAPFSVWPLALTIPSRISHPPLRPRLAARGLRGPKLFVDLEHGWRTCSTSHQYPQDKQTGNCACKYFKTI